MNYDFKILVEGTPLKKTMKLAQAVMPGLNFAQDSGCPH
jgi:hypothetical protein